MNGDSTGSKADVESEDGEIIDLTSQSPTKKAPRPESPQASNGKIMFKEVQSMVEGSELCQSWSCHSSPPASSVMCEVFENRSDTKRHGLDESEIHGYGTSIRTEGSFPRTRVFDDGCVGDTHDEDGLKTPNLNLIMSAPSVLCSDHISTQKTTKYAQRSEYSMVDLSNDIERNPSLNGKELEVNVIPASSISPRDRVNRSLDFSDYEPLYNRAIEPNVLVRYDSPYSHTVKRKIPDYEQSPPLRKEKSECDIVDSPSKSSCMTRLSPLNSPFKPRKLDCLGSDIHAEGDSLHSSQLSKKSGPCDVLGTTKALYSRPYSPIIGTPEQSIEEEDSFCQIIDDTSPRNKRSSENLSDKAVDVYEKPKEHSQTNHNQPTNLEINSTTKAAPSFGDIIDLSSPKNQIEEGISRYNSDTYEFVGAIEVSDIEGTYSGKKKYCGPLENDGLDSDIEIQRYEQEDNTIHRSPVEHSSKHSNFEHERISQPISVFLSGKDAQSLPVSAREQPEDFIPPSQGTRKKQKAPLKKKKQAESFRLVLTVDKSILDEANGGTVLDSIKGTEGLSKVVVTHMSVNHSFEWRKLKPGTDLDRLGELNVKHESEPLSCLLVRISPQKMLQLCHKPQNVEFHADLIMQTHPSSKVFFVVEGYSLLESDAIRNEKLAHRKAVEMAMGNQGRGARDGSNIVTRSQLISTCVKLGSYEFSTIRKSSSIADTCTIIGDITKALLQNKIVSVEEEVDEDYETPQYRFGTGILWADQLSLIPFINLATATAITRAYPTASHLYEQYFNPNISEASKESLLADLPIIEGEATKIGLDTSRKLFYILSSPI